MLPLDHLLQTDTWTRALDKFGAATRLTTVLYNHAMERVLGPIHPTPVFEAAAGPDHPLFTECARRCLVDHDRLITVERFGIGVIGTCLVADGEPLGAVAAGYAVTASPAELAVRRFGLEENVPFASLWRAVRQENPLTKERLRVWSELLHVLTESLLSENVRMRAYQQAAEHLADTQREVEAARRERDIVGSVASLAAAVAHEINNALSILLGQLELLARDVPASGRRRIDESLAATRQIHEIVGRLRHVRRIALVSPRSHLDEMLDIRKSSAPVEGEDQPAEREEAGRAEDPA
jgi:signal transduction histidine kinase